MGVSTGSATRISPCVTTTCDGSMSGHGSAILRISTRCSLFRGLEPAEPEADPEAETDPPTAAPVAVVGDEAEPAVTATGIVKEERKGERERTGVSKVG